MLSTDGTIFRSQDTPENSAAFDSCSVGEETLAKKLLHDIPNQSLTLFDRCYFSADLLLSWESSGENTHWLMPVKRRQRYEIITRYSENALLIEMPISPQARAKNPTLPATWKARMICYQKPKGEIKGFITSLIDPKQYTMTDLLSIYWQRWEIEGERLTNSTFLLLTFNFIVASH